MQRYIFFPKKSTLFINYIPFLAIFTPKLIICNLKIRFIENFYVLLQCVSKKHEIYLLKFPVESPPRKEKGAMHSKHIWSTH